MPKPKKLLYVLTSGPDRPERLYAPFVLATTAKTMNVDATVYFLMRGVLVVKKGEADSIKMGSFPPLKDVMHGAARTGKS
jgi:predicted peroxiredoxin